MKILPLAMLILFIMTTGCRPVKKVNHFQSGNDTLVLVMEKVKGLGVFTGGGVTIEFKDTSEQYDFPVVFPKNITHIKLAWEAVDKKPSWYSRMKEEKAAYLETFLKEYFPWKIDTMHVPAPKDNSIAIMSGIKGKDTLFIVDQNNNKDFRDDSIRLFRELDFKNTDQLIQCKCRIYNGKEMEDDWGWVNIGTFPHRKALYFFVSHRMESTFFIDNQQYQLGVMSDAPLTSFCFDTPVFALTVDNGIKKDSLPSGELLKKGEYLKLKDSYYRLEDVSNNGKYVTLVKEKDLASKVGTQIGMIAPDFKCTSFNEDPVSLKDYKGKYLLLMNITSCWSPVSSYISYKELTEQYKDKVEFLAIDNSPVALQNNIEDLKLTGKFIIAEKEGNEAIRAYRPEYCSRTCFFITPEGRTADKFEIGDWKAKMRQLAVNIN